MEMIIPSCIRGYHVYGKVWMAVMGEELLCERELENVVDRYAIAVKKLDSGITVGHLPKKISRVCGMFTQRGGKITATVTGRRRYSSDLVQGGLEIPCDLTFNGEKEEILQLKKVWRHKKRLHQLVN